MKDFLFIQFAILPFSSSTTLLVYYHYSIYFYSVLYCHPFSHSTINSSQYDITTGCNSGQHATTIYRLAAAGAQKSQLYRISLLSDLILFPYIPPVISGFSSLQGLLFSIASFSLYFLLFPIVSQPLFILQHNLQPWHPICVTLRSPQTPVIRCPCSHRPTTIWMTTTTTTRIRRRPLRLSSNLSWTTASMASTTASHDEHNVKGSLYELRS